MDFKFFKKYVFDGYFKDTEKPSLWTHPGPDNEVPL